MKQKEALNILKSGYNVFLTGSAGTGKTYLLNEYINFLKKKGICVGITASTGIAATHLGGTTIHSFTGMGVLTDLMDGDINRILRKKYLEKKLKKTEVLVIDEISMLSSIQLDIANQIIKAFRNNNRPFGGMQVILCGDFFQLPPISSNREKGLYFNGIDYVYKSRVWNDLDLRICYLEKQYRHKEENLLRILNAIRGKKVDENILGLLRKRYRRKINTKTKITKLYTHNTNVDYINRRELEKIPEKEKIFIMKKSGPKKLSDALSRNLLVPEKLELKKNSVVMFVKNNFERGYVNGTLGRVVYFREGFPVVKTIQGKYIKVKREKWSIIEDDKTKAETEQLPLKLAWAITVHKSQGTTLDAAEIDLSKSFEVGMGYVALSRIRSLEGLCLMGLNRIALDVSEEVFKIDIALQKASTEDSKYFKEINKN